MGVAGHEVTRSKKSKRLSNVFRFLRAALLTILDVSQPLRLKGAKAKAMHSTSVMHAVLQSAAVLIRRMTVRCTFNTLPSPRLSKWWCGCKHFAAFETGISVLTSIVMAWSVATATEVCRTVEVANTMWRKLFYSGFETCFGPSTQGAGTKTHLESRFCAILKKRGVV